MIMAIHNEKIYDKIKGNHKAVKAVLFLLNFLSTSNAHPDLELFFPSLAGNEKATHVMLRGH